ncbi:MAG: type II secretion system F family protein [Acidimicrobiales bacterium]
MIVLLGAVVGSAAGLGLLLVGAGAAGVGSAGDEAPVADRSLRPSLVPGRRLRRSVGLVAVFLTGWFLTGWPALGATWVGAAAVARKSARVAGTRIHGEALADALAGWAEMLADVMVSHSGLGQAIAETASHTAPVLRSEVEGLVADAEEGAMTDALDRFARRLDHPTADLLVAALRIAGDGGGRNLPAVLQKIAAQARARAEMLSRIEAGRARLYAEDKAMVAITGAMVALALVFGRAYLTPYDSLFGQLVLAVVGLLFSTAGLTLVELGRPAPLPNPLGPRRPVRARS